jgi:hypothetical protein
MQMKSLLLPDATQRESDTDSNSDISESQSIVITSININMHAPTGCDLRSTSQANILNTIVKQNNPPAKVTDTVNISITNATLNIGIDVDNIATRMKSNKRRRNNTYNQTRKKSHEY